VRGGRPRDASVDVRVLRETFGLLAEKGFRGLRSDDNGAIVFTTLAYDVVYKRTVAKSTLKMPADVASLLGTGTEITGEVTTTNDVMVAFSIPPVEPTEESGTKPVLLGRSVVLASASKDDSKSPG